MKDLVTPLVLLLSFCSSAAAQQAPKLVVLLTVEELRSDLYEAMAPHLPADGLQRLVSEGKVCRTVVHPLLEADPAASEALLHTGVGGLLNGVPSRRIVLRSEEGRRTQAVSALEDKHYIGYGTADRLSPLALSAPTLSDRLAQAAGGLGQVYAVAPSAEEAIIAGGHEAQAAYWLDETTARWVSSTFYPAGLPWYISKSSTVATQLDKGAVTWRASQPELYRRLLPCAGDGTFSSDHLYTRAFASVRDLKHSPVINDRVVSLAEAIIDGAGLGGDASTDLLALHMTVGTPQSLPAELSPELLDGYLLLDRAVARLLQILDKRFARDEVVVALMGNGMVRRPQPDPQGRKVYPVFSLERCRALSNMYLHAKYGIKGLVTEVTERGELFLDRKLLEEQGGPALAEVQDALAAFLLEMEGVSYTITDHSLRALAPGDPLGRARLTALHSALPRFRADLFVGISPGYVLEETTPQSEPHYAPMPTMLVLWGGGLRPEEVTAQLDLRNVSREVACVLRIRPPAP